MVDDKKERVNAKRSLIITIFLFMAIIILPVMIIILRDYYFHVPKHTSTALVDIYDLMDTLNDLVKYPSYFPEGFNFYEDDSGQIGVEIRGQFTYRGNPSKRKGEDFFEYSITCSNETINGEDRWRLSTVSMWHNIRDFIYRGSGFPEDRMTFIHHGENYNLYFYFFEHEDSLVYSYWFFSNEREHTYYSFGFYFTDQQTGRNVKKEVYEFSLDEAEKMYSSLKVYEEMKQFLHPIFP